MPEGETLGVARVLGDATPRAAATSRAPGTETASNPSTDYAATLAGGLSAFGRHAPRPREGARPGGGRD